MQAPGLRLGPSLKRIVVRFSEVSVWKPDHILFHEFDLSVTLVGRTNHAKRVESSISLSCVKSVRRLKKEQVENRNMS